jgi:hypothetical protein
MNFTVFKRNYGHWDVVGVDRDGRTSRWFTVRGTPGKFSVQDERARPYPTTNFRTVNACMSFICDELMHEEITADEDGCGNNHPLRP